jgi:hypothetical protein
LPAINRSSRTFQEIEFFRDLGPLQHSQPKKEYKLLRKKYLEEMTDADKMRQIFLLILFGIVPIKEMEINRHMMGKEEMKQIQQLVR